MPAPHLGLVSDDSEAYLLYNAQADRAFKKGHVAPSNGRPRKRRVSTEYRDERGCWGFLHSTLLFRHYQHTQNQHHVFGVKYESPVLVLHPEKIKLLLGFLQIFGNFYTNYKTVWPPSVKDAMQASSQFNLDWLSMIRINCLLSTNYFGIFLLTLASMAVFLGILRVFDWRGTYLYKAKLDRIPRSCLHCGFPVLESLSRDAYATLQQQFGDGQLIARRGSLVAHKQCHVAIKRTIGTSQAHATGLPVYMSHHQVCPLLHRLQTAQMKERLLRSNLRVWQARVKLRLNLQLYKAKCFRLGIWLLLCTYPMVAQKVLSIFHCERTSTAYVLVVDRTLTCFSSEWFLYAGVAGVGVALWVVGVPVLFGLLIYRARIRRVDDRVRVLRQPHFAALRAKWLREMRAHLVLGRNERKYTPMSKFLDVQDYYLGVYMQQRNLQDPLVLSRIGFIYNNYDVRYWYCEVVDLVRRLLMSVGVVFLDSMLAQALVGMLICFLTMALLLFLKPYKQWTDTLVSSVMQFQLCLTLFLGIVHTSAPQDGNAERIAMVILGSGLATVVLAGVLIGKEVLDSSRTDLAAMRHRRRAAIQVQVRLRWQRAYRWALFEACTAGVYRPHGRVCIPAMLHLVREATSELRQQHRRLYDHD
ncbi:hypothetical protein, variant [Saprolegnia diclina VS20]|uniref:TRP C-terminal domain-containing protein n=1 Tax=Saprolegnia diclina (strain VS20) TaxID=1156394 RepID=T0Q6W1_SAPDV|nr:hypothetical protein, variant [Saprolegnia diclina VS20]EQC33589.1 hypothetical protein, variant [Saprolegnia diclina VS20]|eukprot:XP_008612812.1 hypothetical protein, variant [Saprolegnia diclina VS20]